MKSNTEPPSDSVSNVCRSGPISDTVVTAVADAKGVDPLEVQPLHSAIDPDALDSMFNPRIGTPPTSLELTFSHDGCVIEVNADGEVVVVPSAAEETDGEETVGEEAAAPTSPTPVADE